MVVSAKPKHQAPAQPWYILVILVYDNGEENDRTLHRPFCTQDNIKSGLDACPSKRFAGDARGAMNYLLDDKPSNKVCMITCYKMFPKAFVKSCIMSKCMFVWLCL